MTILWCTSASILIGAVLLLRRLLQGKISLRLQYALWAVVLVRLLLPGQLPLSLTWSAARLAPEAPQSWERQSVVFSPVLSETAFPQPSQSGPASPADSQPTDIPATGQAPSASNGQTPASSRFSALPLGQIIQGVWLAGALVFAAAFLISNLRFARRLRLSRRPLRLDGVPLPVYAAEGLPSPCLFGLLRPSIYLTPEAAQDETTLRHVLAHELTHRAHWDHIWAVLRCACLALHWFNPLVWLAVFLSKRDSELACDEGAVKRLGEAERLSYGRTLLDMVARRRGGPADLLSCSTAMSGGKQTIQQRVKLLVKRPQTVKTALFAALAVVVLAAVFTFSSARKDYYQQFRAQIGQAQSVSVFPPLHFSVVYLDPITDADLLEQAKALLADPEKIPAGPGELESSVDFSNAAYTSYRLVLDQETTYYFYYAENQCYVLLPQDPDDFLPEKWHYVAVFPTNPCLSLTSLALKQYNRGRTQHVPLTEEELDWFNVGNFFDNNRQEGDPGTFNIHNQFLTSLYDSPEDIDLGELFYNGSGLSSQQPITQAEYDALGYHNEFAPLHKVAAAEMDQVLLEHTGLTLDQTNRVGLDSWQYLAQYGAYYHMHGDTNYNTDLTFTSGTRHEDTVYLYYTDQFGILGGGLCVLTLRQDGEHYYFQSNQRLQPASGTSFRSRAARAQSIYYTGPSYSSVFYPGPIVDADLLEEAKDLFSQAQEVTDIPAELDLARASVDSHRVTLTGGDGAEQTYLLFQQDDLVYVLTYLESTASDYPAEAVMPEDVLWNLSNLARIQAERDQLSDTDYVRFLDTLKGCDSVVCLDAASGSGLDRDISGQSGLEDLYTLLSSGQEEFRREFSLSKDGVSNVIYLTPELPEEDRSNSLVSYVKYALLRWEGFESWAPQCYLAVLTNGSDTMYRGVELAVFPVEVFDQVQQLVQEQGHP